MAEELLKSEVDLRFGRGVGWVLDEHVDAHILDHVGVDKPDRNVVHRDHSRISYQSW